MSEEIATAWSPPPASERPDGFECLIWHRGRWRHVCWHVKYLGWMFGYASAFAPDSSTRFYAPLPERTPDHDFFGDREQS